MNTFLIISDWLDYVYLLFNVSQVLFLQCWGFNPGLLHWTTSPILFIFYFDAGSLWVAQVGFVLAVLSSLSLLSAKIIGTRHHTWLFKKILSDLLFLCWLLVSLLLLDCRILSGPAQSSVPPLFYPTKPCGCSLLPLCRSPYSLVWTSQNHTQLFHHFPPHPCVVWSFVL